MPYCIVIPALQVHVFEAIVRWGRVECTRVNIQDSAENLREVLSDLLPLVRMCEMTAAEFVDVVIASEVLRSELALRVLQRITLAEANRPAESLPVIDEFNCTPRNCLDSAIISVKQQRQIQQWIATVGNNQRIAPWKLLYRASEHNYSAAEFHRLCDNQGATVVIVKSRDYPNICGGYTDIPWDSSNSYKTASEYNKPFLFSLVNAAAQPAVYPAKEHSEYAILCHASHGPVFGAGNDLRICGACNSRSTSYDNPSSYSTITRRQGFLLGSRPAMIAEYEVYKV